MKRNVAFFFFAKLRCSISFLVNMKQLFSWGQQDLTELTELQGQLTKAKWLQWFRFP